MLQRESEKVLLGGLSSPRGHFRNHKGRAREKALPTRPSFAGQQAQLSVGCGENVLGLSSGGSWGQPPPSTCEPALPAR